MKILGIALSGQCSTGKSTLGRLLAEKLEWNYVDVGSEYKKIAKSLNLKIENFGSIPEEQLRQIDDKIKQRMEFEFETIWDSRLSCYLARNNLLIFKIYCVANLSVRAQRTSLRDSITLEEAKQKVLNRDKEETSVFKRLYTISDVYNKKWVDLTLDTSTKTPEGLVDEILNILGL